jgi:large subunit ribosomal protein L21
MAEYAIVETGGKQYRAEKGDTLVVERLPDDEGAKVNLRAVMFRGDKDVVLDPSQLEKVKVEALVAEHVRGPKIRVFKHRPKKGYRRTRGHRQSLTRLEVTEVKMLTRKPAAKKEEAKPAAKKASGRKPAAAKAGSSGGSSRRSASTRKASTTRTKKKDG